MSKTIEQIAAEAEALRAQDSEGDVVTDDDLPETKEAKADPPGFMSYEDWIAAGKDPELYRGKKAYEKEYEQIQEIKGLKKEFKTFTQQLTAATEETLKKEQARMKSELEAKLKQQKDEGDVDGALETKEQLTELKQAVKTGPAPLNPILQDFIEENPLIDKESDDFNQEFFDDMARLQAKEINALSDKGGADLTDRQILKCTKLAFEKAKELNQELFTPKASSRNDRAGLGRKPSGNAAEGARGQSVEVRLKNLTVTDNRNPDMNPNPAYETYKFMKEKYGQKAADKFANSILEG